MLSNKLKSQKGLTLIELLLYISVTSIMLLVISVFLAQLLESRVKNQTIAEVEQQGLQAMLLMTQTIRNAEEITAPQPGNNSASLTIDTVQAGDNPTIFGVAGGVLNITQGGGVTIALTNTRVEVSNVSFSNLSRADTADTIRIEFTISHINPDNRREYSYERTFVATATVRQP